MRRSDYAEIRQFFRQLFCRRHQNTDVFILQIAPEIQRVVWKSFVLPALPSMGPAYRDSHGSRLHRSAKPRQGRDRAFCCRRRRLGLRSARRKRAGAREQWVGVKPASFREATFSPETAERGVRAQASRSSARPEAPRPILRPGGEQARPRQEASNLVCPEQARAPGKHRSLPCGTTDMRSNTARRRCINQKFDLKIPSCILQNCHNSCDGNVFLHDNRLLPLSLIFRQRKAGA